MDEGCDDALPVLEVRGPYFDELEIGPYPAAAPALTLTSGLAAQHRAILGDRLPLGLDSALAVDVVGAGPIADPAVIWDVAIGQSTLVTHRVKANLFYRGMQFRRMPLIGDTLRTSVEVVGLRTNKPKPGQPPTGMAALRMRTDDQEGRVVLDFWRCAMLPLHPDRTGADSAGGATQHAGEELDTIGSSVDVWGVPSFVERWNLDALEGRVPRMDHTSLGAPMRIVVGTGDVVSSAAELARSTLNVAAVHSDRLAAGGRRLVYGGHTVGVAAAQTARALPSMITILSWQSCDHLGPVYEEDTLFSTIEIRRLSRIGEPGEPGYLADLRSVVTAVGADVDPAADEAGSVERRRVLDWRFVGLLH